EEVFSSVFLDKKEEQVLESPKKPKIDLILTPIDELSKTFQQELILSPEILKPVTSIKTDTPQKNKSEPKKVVKKEEHKNSILKEKNKRSNLKNIKEEEKTNLKNIKEKTSNEESLDTKIDIFSHESLVKKTLDFDPFKPKSQEELLGTETKESTNINTPVVLTTTDLKNRLNQLKTKINKTKPNEEINNILKEVGLDVLPNISEQQKEASTALKR
ncbi:MAG: hypothetical protein PHF21_03270, partial [Bacilli bacterium]|nr:hypothetical protein [Bacilli bacterium]